MKLGVLDCNELDDLVTERANSGEWYVIPGFSSKSVSFISDVEQAFYMEENNENFEIIMGTFDGIGYGSFAFALKEDMPKHELNEFAKKVFPGTKTDLDDVDIDFIILDDVPTSVTSYIYRLARKDSNE